MLYDKWWKNTGDVCNRDDKNKESKANALGVENIGKSLDFFFYLVSDKLLVSWSKDLWFKSWVVKFPSFNIDLLLLNDFIGLY